MPVQDLPSGPSGEHVLTEWVAIRDTSNPEVGRTIEKVPEVDVEHGDGTGHSDRLDELGECRGTIRRIGAHWSTAGASGWWCLVGYATEEYSRYCAHYGYTLGTGASLVAYEDYVASAGQSAGDELVGDDSAIVDAIRDELENEGGDHA